MKLLGKVTHESGCPTRARATLPPPPPGWDASPLQGYPQQYVACTHFYTWVERESVGSSFLSKETTRWQELGVGEMISLGEHNYLLA